ncbi:MAG: formylmethanofuran dehydrogenase subunit B [Gemmataceae bacterium]
MAIRTQTGSTPTNATQTPAICTGCGCLCDDVTVSTGRGRLTADTHGCGKGKSWLEQSYSPGPSILVDGRPASLEKAIAIAADLLCQSSNPLVYGLEKITCESAAKAVAIADWLGANLDTTASFNQGPTGLAFQGVGEIACSLGEVRNRADLILFWGADPVATHPRHTSRFSVDPPGVHVPLGRKGRFVVVIDSEANETAHLADLWLRPKAGRDFELLWALRSLIQSQELGGYDAAANGVSQEDLEGLAKRLKGCRFGALFFGDRLLAGPGHHLNADGAVSLAHDINAHTRFYARPLRRAGNPTGSESVTCWQTGYPFGLSMARGFPRFNPGEFTARRLLSSGETDALLTIGASLADHLKPAEANALAAIPRIQIGCGQTSDSFTAPKVEIRTAPFATSVSGTVYRMDDISLPLKPLTRPASPDMEEVLSALESTILHRIRATTAQIGKGAH